MSRVTPTGAVSPTPAADAAAAAPAADRSTPGNGTLLYHQTIIPTQEVSHAVRGSFTLPGSHDFVLVRHDVLELWTLRVGGILSGGGGGGSGSARAEGPSAGGGAECLYSCPLFTAVYGAAAVPTGVGMAGLTPTGGAAARARPSSSLLVAAGGYDYLLLTSETGYATLLRYELAEPPVPTRTSFLPDRPDGSSGRAGDPTAQGAAPAAAGTFVAPSLRGRFVKVSEVCLGRSGARLTVPGARIAVDSRGEAVFISALMRCKVIIPLHHTDFGSADTATQRDGTGLGWLGAASTSSSSSQSFRIGSNGSSDSDADDDGNHNNNGGDGDADGLGEANGVSSAAKRLLLRRKRRLTAPRGLIMLGSPIEAHRQTIIFSVCTIANSGDGAVYAALEQDTVEEAQTGREALAGPAADADRRQKYLVVYAHVPSLRQVQRTHLLRVPASAHRLIPVPGAPHGPGGVLVCTGAELTWYDLSSSVASASGSEGSPGGSVGSGGGVFKCSVAVPRRAAFRETLYDPSIIAHTSIGVGKDYFMLLQDEQGDLFRACLSTVSVQKAYDALRASATTGSRRVVNPLSVTYFDTIAPTTELVLFPRGYLLAATEAGPFHGLYKITRDGYKKESEYIISRLREVRQAPRGEGDRGAHAHPGEKEADEEGEDANALAAGLKRSRDGSRTTAEEGTAVKAEGDARKPGVSGKLLSLLPPLAAAAPAPAPAPVPDRIISIYHPHRALRHMALVSAHQNTPPILSFTTMIPGVSSGSSSSSSSAPLPPGASDTASAATAVDSAAAAPSYQQPQIQFNLLSGRGAGSMLLRARFGYATHREARFTIPSQPTPNSGGGGGSHRSSTAPTYSSVLTLLSAHALQRMVRELEQAIAQAQSVLGDATSAASSEPILPDTARTQAAVRKSIERLLLASAAGEAGSSSSSSNAASLWTDKLLLSTASSTTAYHVGRVMEPDTWTGFAAQERTLAAATLTYGIGYVQVTPRGVHVLAPSPTEGGRADAASAGSPAGSAVSAPARSLVQPTVWTHRHGKLIMAAAATATTVLVSFAQGGGLAAFDFGLTGTQLEQCDELPTFPPSPALSLLQPSWASLTGAGLTAQLREYLFRGQTPRGAGTGAALSARAFRDGDDELSLAAIATVAQEVYIVNPKKLREPLERIRCTAAGARAADGSYTNAAAEMQSDVSANHGIVSVLLTRLGSGEIVRAARRRGSADGDGGHRGAAAQHERRLFCFIGHMDGILTRCELDPTTARVVERVELTCGSAPCFLIPGDGQSVCYVRCGSQAWRCDVRAGVAKVVPWRFAGRQEGSFAAFLRPRVASAAAPSPAPLTKLEPSTAHDDDGGGNDDENDTDGSGGGLLFIAAAAGAGGAGATGAGAAGGCTQDECVVAIERNELSLYTAQRTGSGASALEYSFTGHSLPLEGRRILEHTTRPGYYVILSSEHRGYGMADIKRMREQEQQQQPQSIAGPVALDAPYRPLGRADLYHSSLQLYHEESGRLLPRYFFPEGEAALCTCIGSFLEDFGKEPVVIVGAASQYTHGAGCGGGERWSVGWLCVFRFVVVAAAAARGATESAPPTLRLEPLHRTVIRSDPNPLAVMQEESGGPGALLPPDCASALHVCEDVGLLFVGLGAAHGLRVYVWGQQQLLRKRHLPDVPSRIVAIETAFVSPPPGSATASASGEYFLSDLYHVPYQNPQAMRRAREQQLFIYCATVSHSVLVATLQRGSSSSAAGTGAGAGGSGGGGSVPSFLMIIARDSVPRQLTSMAVLRDGRSVAVADRTGRVALLRVGERNRCGFALAVSALRDAEIAQAEEYLSHEQFLEEVASHATGQAVTSLRVQAYDPSAGADPSLALEMVVYSTSLGAVGAYVPFLTEEDAALAAYAQPLLASRIQRLLAPQAGVLPTALQSGRSATAGAGHHVIEGDLLQVYRQTGTAVAADGAASVVLPPSAKSELEEELARAKKVEAARRRVLGLPARELPDLTDLIARQRALVSLPQ